ncbi:MAG: arsenite methyltransferase [Ignavibacteria bacterium]|nr:arsenite methyltransferase [Ignavibacteria bacterium]
MSENNKMKEKVKKKYTQILKSSENSTSCCSCSCNSETNYTIFSDDYTNIDGYVPEADLNLGCGLPTEFAKIKTGDTVVDLGCGTGNDAFIARKIVGDEGKVIGVDFTNDMIKRAKESAKKLNYHNVLFLVGDIENLPLEESIADVVISNCVLNLVPDKERAFAEIYRILKSGGHFSISDIVSTENIPTYLKRIAELYTGCISGALTLEEYFTIIKKVGFSNIELQSKKEIIIPDEILLKHLNKRELDNYKKTNIKFLSVNIYAEKG